MADYYVNASGSGSGDGSLGDPWASLDEIKTFVTGTDFANGDTIYFNRGDIFYDSTTGTLCIGSSATGLTFDAYGTGDAPVLNATGTYLAASFSDNADGTWTLANTSSASDNGIFEDSISLQQVDAVGDLVAGTFFYDYSSSDDFIYYPTTGDPTDHMVGRGNNKITIDCSTGCTVQNIHFRGGSGSVRVKGGCTVTACTFTDLVFAVRSTTAATTTVSITNNDFYGCIQSIRMESEVEDVFHTSWTITGNTVHSVDQDNLNATRFKAGQGWVDRESIYVQNAKTLVIASNVVAAFSGAYHTLNTNISGSGIVCWNVNDPAPSAAQADDIEIYGNTIGPCKQAGIVVGAGSTADICININVHDNTVTGCAVSGIKINTNNATSVSQVTGNAVSDCGSGLVTLYNRGTNFDGNTVSNCNNFVNNLVANVSNTLDNNIYIGAGGWLDLTTQYTSLAAWQSGESLDADSTYTRQNTKVDCRLSSLAGQSGAHADFSRDSTAQKIGSAGVLAAVEIDAPRLGSHVYV